MHPWWSSVQRGFANEWMHSFDLPVFVTLWLCCLIIFFLNGGQNGAAGLHRVLFQRWHECSKNSQNACEDAFGQTQTYDWLKQFKKWLNISWRCTFWVTFNQHNTEKCYKSAWGYPPGPQVNDSRRLQHCLTVGDVPAHSVDKFNMRQIAAKYMPRLLTTRSNIGSKSAWNLRSRSEMTYMSFPKSWSKLDLWVRP